MENRALQHYNDGVEFDDNGLYEKALESYDKAIAIDLNQNNLEIDRDRKIALQHL